VPDNMPLVSIIMPTYNSSEFVLKSINSILSQTYLNFELLITDDCSTDDTLSVLNSAALLNSKIKIFRLDVNSGAAIARNNSIEKANGRYIAFCDSDDLWLPNKLETQIEFMSKNQYPFTYTFYDVFYLDQFKNSVKPPLKLSFSDLLVKNHIGCLTVMYDVSMIGKIYMPLLRNRQDWGLWLLIIQKCNYAVCLGETLAIYNIRKSSISRSKFYLLKFHYKIYREVMNFNYVKSVYYLSLNLCSELLNKFSIL
jgi:teichuronic acid biosynthesis glycosyltransferase TuaG